jgi:hypothetical protein
VSLNEIFESIAGQRFEGGCDDCNAWQEMTRQHGIYVIEISHDDTCPFLAQHQAITRREATS